MPTNILIPFYSSYGHLHKMAHAVAEGARSAEDTDVKVVRIPELEAARQAMSGQDAYVQAQEAMAEHPEVTHDDLRWADGIIWGTPTRYGNMTAQMKAFIDTTGGLWANGELTDKVTGVFVGTSTVGSGQETTVLTTMIPMLHLGMIFVGSPYSQNPELFSPEARGGSPYGPGTLAGSDGSRQPIEDELNMARNLGVRIAKVAAGVKHLRG